jgi:hypothetical protein
MVVARNFLFFRPIQTSPGAHPPLCIMGTGVLSRGQSGRGVALTTHTSSAKVSMSRVTPLFPLCAGMKCDGETLTLRTVSCRRKRKPRSKWKYREMVTFRPWPRFRIVEVACTCQISGAKTVKLCYLTICFKLIYSPRSSHSCFIHALNKRDVIEWKCVSSLLCVNSGFMGICLCHTKKISQSYQHEERIRVLALVQ